LRNRLPPILALRVLERSLCRLSLARLDAESRQASQHQARNHLGIGTAPGLTQTATAHDEHTKLFDDHPLGVRRLPSQIGKQLRGLGLTLLLALRGNLKLARLAA
jgi:hypothetical protein